MTTTTGPLFAAILASLEDDGVRLAYADSLDYDEYDPRAELIRVQHGLLSCGLTECRRQVSPGPGAAGNPHKVNCRRCEWCVRKEHERQLLAANSDWAPKCAACEGYGGFVLTEDDRDRQECPACNGTGRARCDWRCGFPDRVHVPTIASVLFQRWLAEERLRVCGRDPWIATDYARYLRAEFPTLRGVMPLDRNPVGPNSGLVSWFSDDSMRHPYSLPSVVFERLTGGQRRIAVSTVRISGQWSGHKDADAANDALATALRAVLWEKMQPNAEAGSPDAV